MSEKAWLFIYQHSTLYSHVAKMLWVVFMMLKRKPIGYVAKITDYMCGPGPLEPIKLPELLPQFYYVCVICGKTGHWWATTPCGHSSHRFYLQQWLTGTFTTFFGLSHIAECNYRLMPAVFVSPCMCAGGGQRWSRWVHMLAWAPLELSVVCCICSICYKKQGSLC